MATQGVSLGSPNSRKSGKVPAEGHVDSHAVTKRLQSELMALMASADVGISAFPDGDSLFAWLGTIQGAAGTAFEGLSYKLSLKFPSGMPPCLSSYVCISGCLCVYVCVRALACDNAYCPV